MGLTITEKILLRHADLTEIRPGMLVNARVDVALGHDITAPIAIAEFRKAGGTKVFDPAKVVLVAPRRSSWWRTTSPPTRTSSRRAR